MDERPKRGRGRPPLTGERLDKLRVNIPPSIIAQLTEEATARATSMSNLVREILTEWLERHRGTRHDG